MRPPANRKARLSHEFDDYFPGVDRNDLQALNGLCLEWRVDLEPNICAQEAMIKAMQAAAGFEQPPAIVPGSVGGDGLETRVLAALSIALRADR